MKDHDYFAPNVVSVLCIPLYTKRQVVNGGLQINVIAISYCNLNVIPVLWMTSCFHITFSYASHVYSYVSGD